MSNINATRIYTQLNWNNLPGQDAQGLNPDIDAYGTVWEDLDPTLGRRLFSFVNLALSSAALTTGGGNVVLYKDLYRLSVSVTVADSAQNLVAGVTQDGTPVVGNDCWVQTKGYHGTVLANGDTYTKGKYATSSGTAAVVRAETAGTAPTYTPVGQVLGASAGSPLVVPLQLVVPCP